MKIAILGLGVVGQAVASGCYGCTLATFDKYNQNRTQNLGIFNETEICFVCVPTPTDERGQDLAEVRDALNMLASRKYPGVVVIKSTVLPGTMRSLRGVYPTLRLVHNPEFLTEKNAKRDFQTQKTVLMSGEYKDTAVVDKFYAKIVKVPQSFITPDFESTEWAKYIHNCALPVMLSFLNDIYDLIGSQAVFEKAVSMAEPFGNVGTLNKVPGPDGKRGWGGMCFPKDTKALAVYAGKRGIPTHTLIGAIATNVRHRPEEMLNQTTKEKLK